MRIKELLKKLFYYMIDANFFFYRFPFKLDKENVEIKKNDKDIWSSYPHIHVLNDSKKIDIYTGEIYRIQTKRLINQLSDDDMEKLWNDSKFLDIVIEARKNKPINVGRLEEILFKWINEENSKWIENYNSNIE